MGNGCAKHHFANVVERIHLWRLRDSQVSRKRIAQLCCRTYIFEAESGVPTTSGGREVVLPEAEIRIKTDR
jgi:hypothetical protein